MRFPLLSLLGLSHSHSWSRLLLIKRIPALNNRVLNVPRYFCSSTANRFPATAMSLLPSLPSPSFNDTGRALQAKLSTDLSGIDRDIQTDEAQRDEFFKLTRQVTVNSLKMLSDVKNGNISQTQSMFDEAVASVRRLLSLVNDDPCQRESRVSFLVEKICVPRLLQHFFLSGKLAKQADLSICNDEEYLGAVIAFSQELSRYAVNRAGEGDFASIELCRCVVVQIHEAMLSFDFRNGPLRRKFDGLKYAQKNIEDIAFELSLQDTQGGVLFSLDLERSSKRAKTEEAPAADEPTTNVTLQAVDAEEFAAICSRMTEYDQKREQVIKDSRDVQKLAKQSIFAVMRGQTKDAEKKLNDALAMAGKIMSVVELFPTLRPGSFSNSLEEWAEGMMLLQWVKNQTIPNKAELPILNNNEYIGGLSDFTGEIGRLAVMLAAKRDLEAVRAIQQADIVVADFISQLNIGNRFGKKLDAVNMNLKKVEDIVYELCMLERSGRSKRAKVGADLSSSSAAEGPAGIDNEI